MRRNIVIACIMAAAAVACTKKMDEPVVKTVISVSTAQTKTSFGEKDGTSIPVLWNTGDQLNVNGVASQALAEGGEASAKFVFESELSAPYFAAYPASAVSAFSEGSATIALPATQQYVAGSFDPAAGILVGTGDENGVSMVNLMAYLRIQLTGAGDQTASVKITANSSEALSGNFTTDYASMTAAGGNGSEITVNCNGIDLGTDIIVALPAQTYASGLTVTVTDVNGKETVKTSSKSAGMVAGHLYSTSINVTEDAFYLVGGSFSKFEDWKIHEGLKLLPQGDGTYVSDRDIWVDKWAYFRVAKADWSEDYSRVQGASEYWSMQPKAAGDEEPFIPGNFNNNWKEGYYCVVFDKANMKLRLSYVGGTENMPFYLNGAEFHDGTTDWNLVDEHKLDRVASGIYTTVTPVQLKQWVYFKFDTTDWTEYVRSQAPGVDYWTVEARNGDNDCNFVPKNWNYNWTDGLYNITLNLRTMSVSCEYAGPIPGYVDPNVALYVFGGGFSDPSHDWEFVDSNALMPTSENVYASVQPIYLNEGCYFKFDKKDWTEYRRDATAADFWTIYRKTADSDPDNYFYISQNGDYDITVNLNTMKVTCTLVQ